MKQLFGIPLDELIISAISLIISFVVRDEFFGDYSWWFQFLILVITYFALLFICTSIYNKFIRRK